MRARIALLVAGFAACAPERAPPAPEVVAPAVIADETGDGVASPERPRGGPGCIRGGSTHEEVRAVMGEPDSISFGAWIYGRSSVTFGYGTVLDLENEGGELIVC